MKLYSGIGVCVAVLLPQWAFAELPFGDAALGQLEGALAFCAKVDPPSAKRYQEQARILTGTIVAKDLVKVRSAKEYTEASQGVIAQLDGVPKDDAIKNCRASLMVQ
jgi:hypothetical protein